MDEVVVRRPRKKSGYPSIPPQRKETSTRERGRNFLSRLLHLDDGQEDTKHQAGSKSLRFPVARDRARVSTLKKGSNEHKSPFPWNMFNASYGSSGESSDEERYGTRLASRRNEDEARRQFGAGSKKERPSNRTRPSTTKARDSERVNRTGKVSVNRNEDFEEADRRFWASLKALEMEESSSRRDQQRRPDRATREEKAPNYPTTIPSGIPPPTNTSREYYVPRFVPSQHLETRPGAWVPPRSDNADPKTRERERANVQRIRTEKLLQELALLRLRTRTEARLVNRDIPDTVDWTAGTEPVSRRSSTRPETRLAGVCHHSVSARNKISPEPPVSPHAKSGRSSVSSLLSYKSDIASDTPPLAEDAELEGTRSPKRDASRALKRTALQPGAGTSNNKDETLSDREDAEVIRRTSLNQMPAAAPVRTPTTPTLERGRTNNPQLYGWHKAHLILGPIDEDILVATNPLGHGSLGVVDEVCHKSGRFPSFVRKRIKLPAQKRKAATYLNIAKEEARILKSLAHPHIVALVGSYEDMKLSRSPSYCLLMAPVGENDLETFLAIVGEHDVASEFSIHWRACIRTWMACLASALKYMHASGIRHQDIKPSNIIHKGEHIFFTDFSSSSTFKVGHTTSTENPARSTPMYGAPEVTSDRARHGQTTDIFALGCVFSEMLSVAEGQTVSGFQEYLHNSGELHSGPSRGFRQGLSYSGKVPFMSEWFAGSHLFDVCISRMLRADRNARPRAAEVLHILMANQCGNRSCLCLRAQVLQMDVGASSVVSVD